MFDFLHVTTGADALLAEAQREGITLFGAGNFAHAVQSALKPLGIRVHAYVVSGAQEDYSDQVPVVGLAAMDDAYLTLPIWIAVYNRSATADLISIAATCRARGLGRIILPQQYYEIVQHQLGWRFWLADRRGYTKAREDIEFAYELLDDEESRQGFLATLKFRLAVTTDSTPCPSASLQYFPPEIITKFQNDGQGCVFVDGGAYDGDTLIQAATHLSLARAYAFEPDIANYSQLAANTRRLGIPVINFPCGLSDRTQWLAFAGDNGEACSVSAAGDTRIQCLTLDECLIGEHTHYIKLDIEGHELAALAGASGIIARDRPALAIAAYHRWDDLWRIPAFIREVSPDYRLLYRTHEYNTFDSVFYAVSNQS